MQSIFIPARSWIIVGMLRYNRKILSNRNNSYRHKFRFVESKNEVKSNLDMCKITNQGVPRVWVLTHKSSDSWECPYLVDNNFVSEQFFYTP